MHDMTAGSVYVITMDSVFLQELRWIKVHLGK